MSSDNKDRDHLNASSKWERAREIRLEWAQGYARTRIRRPRAQDVIPPPPAEEEVQQEDMQHLANEEVQQPKDNIQHLADDDIHEPVSHGSRGCASTSRQPSSRQTRRSRPHAGGRSGVQMHIEPRLAHLVHGAPRIPDLLYGFEGHIAYTIANGGVSLFIVFLLCVPLY